MKNNEQEPLVVLDADHTGELLAFLADYHTYLNEAYATGEATDEDTMFGIYLLGNLEGRVIGNHITNSDLEVVEEWKEELEMWKFWHNDNIITPSV